MRYIQQSIVALLCAAIPSVYLNAQNYNMPYSDKLEITAGEGYIYDNGGSSGNYQNNSSDTLVIRPEIPGRYVKLICEQLYMDNYSDDRIEIYSSDTLLNKFDLGPADIPSPQIYAHDTSGAITIVFVSDESSTSSGFRFYYTTIDQPPLADLSINTHTLNKHEVTAGDHLLATASLINLGPDDAHYYSVDYYLSTDTIYSEGDHFLNAASYAKISVNTMPGISANCLLEIPEGIDIGTYYILGRVTDVAGEQDSETTNSSIHEKVDIVEPYLDFHVSGASIGSNLIYTNIPFNIGYGIENSGNYITQQPVQIGFFLSGDMELDAGDFFMGESTMYGIDTTHTYWNNIKIDSLDFSPITEGVHYLIVASDYNDMYSESNEDNNLFVSQVLVYKSHIIMDNLVLSSLQPAVDTMTSGLPVQVALNLSSDHDFETASIDLYMSADTLLDNGDIHLNTFNNITFPTSEKVVKVNIQCTLNGEEGINEGTYYIIAVADQENQVIENNESDNTSFSQVYVTERIVEDLGLGDITLNCDSLLNNQRLYVYANVQNFGSSKSVNGKIHCYLSVDSEYDVTDVFIGENTFNYFEPGSIISRGVYYPNLHLHDPGDYHVIVMLDPLNEVNENNEINNFGVVPLKLLDPALIDSFDVELLEVVAPDTVAPGSYQYLGFRYFFYNDESASINASIYLSKDSVLDIEDLSSRLITDGFYAAGYQESKMSYSYRFLHYQDTGKFFLIVKADDYNYLAEDNENNNLLIKPIYIYPDRSISEGDLKIVDIDLNSAILSRNNRLEGMVTVSPQFSPYLDTAFVEFYIKSKDTQLEELVLVETLYNLGYDKRYVDFSCVLPAGSENGLYQLRCLVRTSQGVVDRNPGNNEYLTYFAVQDVDLDFSIDRLRLDRNELFQSESLTVHFDVRNNGTTVPAAPSYSCYLSTDMYLSEEDTEILTSSLQDLGIQHTRSQTVSVSVPPGMNPGPYYLIVAIDANDLFPESNESNNIQAVPFDLVPTGPNLVVQGARISTQEICRGVPFTAFFTLANMGSTYAYSSRTGLYISEDSIFNESDIYLTSKYISSLSPGQQVEYSVSVLIENSIISGSYYLFFVADMYEDISETNQDDNVLALPVAIVPPSFDLEIIGSNVQDTLRTMELSRINLALDVINNGEHTISDYFKIYGYISLDTVFDPFGDIYIGSDQVREDCPQGITLSKYITLYLPDIIGKGQYRLFFFLDAEGDIDETNEVNNVFSMPVVITDLDVDIALTDLDFASDTLPINTKVECSFTVANIGTTYCLDLIRIEFYMSRDTILDSEDVYMGYRLVSPLDAQEEASGTTSFYMPSGYTMGRSYFIADANSTGDENPNNNTLYRSLYIRPPDHDLTMGSINLTPSAADPGELVNIYFWTNNEGTDDITRSFKVKYFFSDDMVLDENDLYLGEEYFSSLGGHTTRSESVYFNVPPSEAGTYYLLFISDSENSVSETDESNNTAFVPFHVNALGVFPDYAIENVNFSHDREENRITVQFALHNQGQVAGGSATYCSFYASHDEYMDESDYLLGEVNIEILSPENETPVSFEQVIPNTEYNYIIIVVDEDQLIDDQNRYNNIHHLELQYELPFDLGLQIELVSTEICPGDSLSIMTHVDRQGAHLLDSVLISYYIGRDSILEFAERPILEKMLTLSGSVTTYDSFSYVMPETVDEGSWYAMVFLNWDSVWIEQSAENNFVVLPFEVVQKPNHIGPDGTGPISIQLYPNPARDFILLESSVIMDEYILTDFSGRILGNGKLLNTEARIAVDAMPPGLYMLIVRTWKGEKVKRFVIY